MMAWSKFMILAKLPVKNLLHAIRSMHGQVCMGSIAIGPPTFLPLATPLIHYTIIIILEMLLYKHITRIRDVTVCVGGRAELAMGVVILPILTVNCVK